MDIMDKQILYISSSNMVNPDLIKWSTHCVSFKPSSVESLSDCFDSYTRYLYEDLGKVPLSKKMFSQGIRTLFLEKVSDGSVKFNKRSMIFIYGIELKT